MRGPGGIEDAARAHDATARVPFCIAGRRVGSVARAHLAPLRVHLAALGALGGGLHVDAASVHLDASAASRDALLHALNVGLRDAGLIGGWRDETVAVLTRFGAQPLALIERAAARFWGTLTFGAHANGYVAGAAGTPTRLWIARRAPTKAIDPGKLDNLVGGGVPWGETPLDALVREGDEEAGLDAALMRRAVAAGSVELHRDVPEGLQHERIFCFDLALPAGVQPRNRDGEVAEFALLSLDEALRRAEAGEMTVDAALVTLDFARRHGAAAG
jgi:8-oxo-dGTP pyrophosphatase MutT (NUDIX family)